MILYEDSVSRLALGVKGAQSHRFTLSHPRGGLLTVSLGGVGILRSMSDQVGCRSQVLLMASTGRCVTANDHVSTTGVSVRYPDWGRAFF